MLEERQSRDPAMLACEARLSCGEFVLHRFAICDATKIMVEGKEVISWEDLYRCQTCGHLRRWGISAQRW
jgi:hypothetical protein